MKEISASYVTGKVLKAYVYYSNAGTWTLRGAAVTLTEEPAGSGLYSNAGVITGLAAGDRVIVHDETTVDTIVGGGEYIPEVNVDAVDDIITANALIISMDANVDEIHTNVGVVDGIVDAIKAQTDNLPADPAAVSDITALNDLSQSDIHTALDSYTNKDDWKAVFTPEAGAIRQEINIQDTSDQPVANASVWVSLTDVGGNVIISGVSDNFGTLVCYLTPGTYYLFAAKAGYNFDNPLEFEVVEV